MVPKVPDALVSLLAAILPYFGFKPEEANEMLTAWEGWPVAMTLANYSAKVVPGSKRAAYEFKGELMRIAVPHCPPGLCWDPTDGGVYRWRVDGLDERPQLGFHSMSTTGSEKLPVGSWDGVRWQNEEGIKKLISLWNSRRK